MKDWITIKTMHNKGIPVRQIARDLQISRNTVKRLITINETKEAIEIFRREIVAKGKQLPDIKTI